MLKSLTLRAALPASALAAIATLALMPQSSPASAREILSCKGSSRQSVVECCQREVLKKGQPIWMREAGGSCHSMVVKCKGGTFTAASAPNYCVSMLYSQRGKGDPTRGGGRSPNGNGTAGKP